MEQPNYKDTPANDPSYPIAARTPMQRQVLDCARCLFAQDEDIKNEKVVECTGLSDTTTYACLEKFTRTGLFSKEKGRVEGSRRGGPPILYVPNPDAEEKVVPALQPRCPTREKRTGPLNLISSHFTPMQRQLLGCMACMHQRYGDKPSSRLGIITVEARECSGAPVQTVAHAFKRAQQANLIKQKTSKGRQKVYTATSQGADLFEAIKQEVVCSKEWPEDELDPVENRSKIMRCLACLSFQRQGVGLALTASMIGYCQRIPYATLARQIIAIEKDGLLQRLPHTTREAAVPNAHHYRMEPRPELTVLAGGLKRSASCNFNLVESKWSTEELRTFDTLLKGSLLERWQVARIMRHYPADEQPLAIKYLEFLRKHDMLRVAKIHDPVVGIHGKRYLRMAVQNHTLDPTTGTYLTFGPNLTRFNNLQQHVILHVLGGDLFVYGKRLAPAYLRAMLNIDPGMSLADYARTLLNKLPK